MRINNAIRYRTGDGFDAVENVEYIRMLLGSWALPEPDAGWATSHPPLFYYASAAVWRALAALGWHDAILIAIPLLGALAGGVAIGAAVWWVHRSAPDDASRAVVAGALLVFLPVHVYMAAMISEELIATMWISLALVTARPLLAGEGEPGRGPRLGRAAAVGALGGLAMLTKLTGVLVVAAIAATWLIGGLRSGRMGIAFARCAALAVAAAAVGGWYYLYTLLTYGYLYPQDLVVHEKMFDLPPGARGLADYLRFPLATFSDPQLRHPDLLHSVWGGTYDTVWFDGHRHFLARSTAVTRIGTAIALLALLPTAAFVAGLARGLRRAFRSPGGADTLLSAITLLTLAGYVGFTLGNPWYVTVKGSYLLGLSVPFAVYASESLVRWTGRRGAPAIAVWTGLAALAILVVATFTIGPFFVKSDGPGLPG